MDKKEKKWTNWIEWIKKSIYKIDGLNKRPTSDLLAGKLSLSVNSRYSCGDSPSRFKSSSSSIPLYPTSPSSCRGRGMGSVQSGTYCLQSSYAACGEGTKSSCWIWPSKKVLSSISCAMRTTPSLAMVSPGGRSISRFCCCLQSMMAVMELPLTLMPKRCHSPSANRPPNLMTWRRLLLRPW